MSYRAVVDEDDPVMFGEPHASYEARARVVSRGRGKPLANAPDPEPPSRALCAVSEDRQWLVMLEDGDWRVRKRDGEGRYVPLDEDGGWWVIDTGQDAHAVLATWLEGCG